MLVPLGKEPEFFPGVDPAGQLEADPLAGRPHHGRPQISGKLDARVGLA
jgi:hypothetical protein